MHSGRMESKLIRIPWGLGDRRGRLAALIAVMVLVGTTAACTKSDTKPDSVATPTVAATSQNPTQANATVTVTEGGGSSGGPVTTKSFTATPDALAYASTSAGFNVAVPTYLPSGYAIVEIVIPPKPPTGVSGQLQRVTLKFRGGTSGFDLLLVNSRFTFSGDDAAHVIATPASGSQIFKGDTSAGASGVSYTLLTPTKGASVTSSLGDAEVIRILSSLPQN